MVHRYFRNGIILFGKDRFAKVSKTRYRFEYNFVWTIKIIM